MPWDEWGDSEIGVINLQVVELVEPTAEREIVHGALKFALRFAGGDNPWIFYAYLGGLKAYDTWRGHLADDSPPAHGAAYNAHVRAESRGFAPAFLRRSAEKLPDVADDLERAARHYDEAARELDRVAELFPYQGDWDNVTHERAALDEAVGCLIRAKNAETAGPAELERIGAALR